MAAATASSAAETAIRRDARMRRVAILLSSLPGPLAAKMLGSIDPASKQNLRRTMATLSNVDPMERHRVIEAFRVSIGRVSKDQFAAGSEGGDTFESSGSAVSSDRYATNSTASPILKNVFPEDSSSDSHMEPTSPLTFLGDVDDVALSDLLKEEHPQAVAIVLASVPPQKAGRILSLLPDQLRSQALSRIGRLGEIPEQAAADLASHFHSRIGKPTSVKSTATGQRKLDAILASMPTATAPSNTGRPNQENAVQNYPAQANPAQANPAQANPSQANTVQANSGQASLTPTHRSDAEVSAIDLTHRLRVVSDDFPMDRSSHPASDVSAETPKMRSQAALGSSPVAAPTVATPSTALLDSTDAIHARLIGLTPIQLCQSLGRVETRDAMLCLCGLPNPVAEAALAMLPKEQAKTVRGQMNGLNLLNLRDIDDAKERVAQASMMFVDQSSVSPTDAAAA